MVLFRGVESGMKTLRPDDAPASLYAPDGQPQFFQDPAMDRFVAVLLNLASELWVQTERVETLTACIARAGLADDNDPAAIVAAQDVQREAALRDFVTRVLAPVREGVG
jgi:hypothetical protein